MARIEVQLEGKKAWAWTVTEKEGREILSMVGQYIAEKDGGIWPEEYRYPKAE